MSTRLLSRTRKIKIQQIAAKCCISTMEYLAITSTQPCIRHSIYHVKFMIDGILSSNVWEFKIPWNMLAFVQLTHLLHKYCASLFWICIAKINDYLTHDLYGGTVWLIWVCKVIFTSNPTEGQVRLYCGWSWGFDNNILMKHNLLYSTKPNHTHQTKPYTPNQTIQTKPNQTKWVGFTPSSS